jgi:hypothetical protein
MAKAVGEGDRAATVFICGKKRIPFPYVDHLLALPQLGEVGELDKLLRGNKESGASTGTKHIVLHHDATVGERGRIQV